MDITIYFIYNNEYICIRIFTLVMINSFSSKVDIHKICSHMRSQKNIKFYNLEVA